MATNINIENYEAFLLDYMEGNLSNENTSLLLQFVVLHPELGINLNELELVQLNDEQLIFENKNNLKKSAGDLVSLEQYISYIENELTQDEKTKIDFLAKENSAISNELNLYKKTILTADSSILFENKNALKKEPKVIWLYSRQTLSIAASILLVFGCWMIFKYYNPVNTSNVISSTLPDNEIKTVEKKESINKVTPLKNSTENKNISKASNQNLRAATITNKQKIKKIVVSNNIAVAQTNTIITTTVPENIIANTNNLVVNETQNSPTEIKSTRAYIITEKAFDEDEKAVASAVAKKGFWSKAKKALNGLNQIGLKAVNGTESNVSNSDQVVLSLGNFSVENKKYNQE